MKLGLGLDLTNKGVSGGSSFADIEVTNYGYDTAGFWIDNDFSSQSSFNCSVSGADLTLITEGGNGGRYGVTSFVTSLKKTVDSSTTYSLKFHRELVSTSDAAQTDTTTTSTIMRGLNFGFVADQDPEDVVLLLGNYSGYAVNYNDAANQFFVGKLTRLEANESSAAIGNKLVSSTNTVQTRTDYATPSDLNDGDIELRIVPGATNYTLSMYANENLVLTMLTDIPKTVGDITPFFHLNNWNSTSNNSHESLTNITVEES